MNEFACPCGYRAIGSISGILRASENHRDECHRNVPTNPVEHIDPDCTGGKHAACPGWTFADDLDRTTPCECACHNPEEHQP